MINWGIKGQEEILRRLNRPEGRVKVVIDTDTFNEVDDQFAVSYALLKPERFEILALHAAPFFNPNSSSAGDGMEKSYQEILKIAEKYEMKILEDGAQGFGGMLGSKRACSFGDASITSFFPAKPLGCYGDGGAIFTDSDEMAAYLESIRVHGKGSYKYENIRIGWNSRLDTLQAAIMLPKLKAFQEYELENVNLAAGIYTEQLKEIVKTPIVPKGYLSSWAQYTIQLKDEKERNGLQEYLKSKGIPSMIYYPIPMHCQRAFDELKLYQECLVTEKLCKTVLALPMHPYLNSKEQGAVINEIQKFLKGV